MSSRALRKAQKQREEEQLREKLQATEEVEDDEDEEDDVVAAPAAKPSLFAMLQDQDGDQDEEDDDENEDDDAQQQPVERQEIQPSTPQPKPSKKKKKKKGKAKAPTKHEPTSSRSKESSFDEIDQALASLKLDRPMPLPKNLQLYQTVSTGEGQKSTEEVCKQLAINQHDLIVSNELRRLFGRDAVAAEHAEELQRSADRRRSQNREQAVSLSEAVTGKFSVGGPGLSKVLIRKNLFVHGKEEWPKVTANGLGMEVITKHPGDVTTYRFTRDKKYMGAQFEFTQCASSGDPNTLVGLVRYNPYHIGTLLRVSEIARIMDKDHATAGELLERALFAFGRSLHPSFAESLAHGKARLDFSYPENREFYLTAWKYMGNISMRATWRTAYEWSRLLLSLNPEDDPYCMRLVVDQYAIRSKQGQSLLDLCNLDHFVEKWVGLPNIAYSKSLALKLVGKQEEAQQALVVAIEKFPWVAARLYQELNLDKLPKAIWGKQASTEIDTLLSELYVTEGLDIWKVPNNLKFLTEVATTLGPAKDTPVQEERPISRDEARLILLIDKPALTTLIPYSLKSKLTSQLDPLPPEGQSDDEDGDEDESEETGGIDPDDLIRENPRGFFNELRRLSRFLERLVPSSEAPAGGEGQGQQRAAIEEDTVGEALARANMTVEELQNRVRRLLSLREALGRQPGGRVRINDEVEVAVVPWNQEQGRQYGDSDDGSEYDEAEDEDEEFHDANEN